MSDYQFFVAGGSIDAQAETELRIVTAARAVLHSDGHVVRAFSLEEAIDSSSSVAAILLIDEASRNATETLKAIASAKASTVPLLPILLPGSTHAQLPDPIKRLNSLEAADPDVGVKVLRLLGVVEADRRLFLSYRRTETSAVALQLRTALSERRFDVFLDRFSVPPGADFQRRIDIELSDKAFVLLLESASAVGSEWVQHEVVYALSHHIAVLALTMPGTSTDDQFEVVDDGFRMQLDPTDLAARNGDVVLTEGALSQILSEVEVKYAREMRRRRLQVLGSALDVARQAGYETHELDDWTYLATRDEDQLVIHSVAAAPTPNHLREADRHRRALRSPPGGAIQALVVHSAYEADPEFGGLMDWIVEDRPLRRSSVLDLPRLLA